MTRPAEVKVFKAPPPTFARNEMYYISDGYDWVYEPDDPFEKIQVSVPCFFNNYRQELHVGTRITCRLGNIQDGITEVELQVIKCDRTNEAVDVEVSVGASRKFTPVRHDGSQTGKKDQAA